MSKIKLKKNINASFLDASELDDYEDLYSRIRAYNLDWLVPYKCECGGTKLAELSSHSSKYEKHADWCPRYENLSAPNEDEPTFW